MAYVTYEILLLVQNIITETIEYQRYLQHDVITKSAKLLARPVTTTSFRFLREPPNIVRRHPDLIPTSAAAAHVLTARSAELSSPLPGGCQTRPPLGAMVPGGASSCQAAGELDHRSAGGPQPAERSREDRQARSDGQPGTRPGSGRQTSTRRRHRSRSGRRLTARTNRARGLHRCTAHLPLFRPDSAEAGRHASSPTSRTNESSAGDRS